MGFFYKKCEVCGNKIKKCNSMKEYIFGSVEVNCNNCQTKYKPRAGEVCFLLYIFYIFGILCLLLIFYLLFMLWIILYL